MRSRQVRVGGTLAAVLGALLLLLAGVLPQAGTAEAAAPSGGGGAVTVDGPPVWLPGTGAYGPKGKVTVSPAVDLTDQVVHVSWTGFTPTVDPSGAPVTIDPGGQVSSTIFYGVRIYECRGTDPKITDCYGSTLYGADPAKGFQQGQPPAGSTTPEFPTNQALAVTRPDGSGEADIEAWTAHESQSLGCDPTHACSIVVEPNYGGDPLGYAPALGIGAQSCENHTWDQDNSLDIATASDYIFTSSDVNSGNEDGEQCAWTHHVVVPLQFAPTAADCAAKAADFGMRGLEMADRMVQSWRAGFCHGTGGLSVQYSPGGGEPQARQAFLSRTAGSDIALTAYPDTAPAPRPYVYAPLATSGIVVTFRTDDRITGAPITTMRLNARLLAKQLTQSYVGNIDPNAYDSTKGNPNCIYQDPEFLALNPEGPNGPHWPDCTLSNGGAALPIVVGGTTDLVQQLTSWIASDPDAASFLAGKPDPWGMHLNTFYGKPGFAGYLVNVFIPQDNSASTFTTNPKPSKTYEWVPQLGGLSQVARGMLSAQPASLQWSPDLSGNHPRVSPEPIGSRAVMAVLDAGQAAAFSLPEAQLLNPAGSYVSPGDASFAAAVDDMATDSGTGTSMLPYTSPSDTGFAKDTSAYPLTTVQYAMLPTQGVAASKVAKIVDFLNRAGNPSGGQQPGFQPGSLPAGFVPLTTAQRTQLTLATCDVQRQDGQKPGNQSGVAPCATKPGGTGGGGTGSGGSSSGGSTSGGTAGGLSGGASSSGSGGLSGGSSGGSTGATSGGTSSGSTGSTAGTTPASAGNKPQALASVQPVAAGQPDPNRVGGQRLLLPILLIAGAVLLVGGPTTLVLTGTDAGAQMLRGGRRLWRRAGGLVRRG